MTNLVQIAEQVDELEQRVRDLYEEPEPSKIAVGRDGARELRDALGAPSGNLSAAMQRELAKLAARAALCVQHLEDRLAAVVGSAEEEEEKAKPYGDG